MKKIVQGKNPKALNINAIQDNTSKVTLGFKCTPQLKIQLAALAAKNGLTLSSYTEMILIEGQRIIENQKSEIVKLKSSLINQKQKLEFYECPILQKLFLENKNQLHRYKNSQGETVNLRIETLEDTYTIIINSFK